MERSIDSARRALRMPGDSRRSHCRRANWRRSSPSSRSTPKYSSATPPSTPASQRTPARLAAQTIQSTAWAAQTRRASATQPAATRSAKPPQPGSRLAAAPAQAHQQPGRVDQRGQADRQRQPGMTQQGNEDQVHQAASAPARRWRCAPGADVLFRVEARRQHLDRHQPHQAGTIAHQRDHRLAHILRGRRRSGMHRHQRLRKHQQRHRTGSASSTTSRRPQSSRPE